MTIVKCERCGNMAEIIDKKACPLFCCGEKMTELEANTVDASREKHVPEVSVDGNTVSVRVGSVDHPMLDAHYIAWIAIETDKGTARKYLKPGDAPAAVFALSEGEKLTAVYAYCNLHGLWKA